MKRVKLLTINQKGGDMNVYLVNASGYVDVYGSLKSAYEAAVCGYTNPVEEITRGIPGPECRIEQVPATLSRCKDAIKARNFWEVRGASDNEDHVIAIERRHVIRD